MFAEERQEQIMKDLLIHKRVTVMELSEKYQASIHTIRRDLKILEEQGLLTRTHGGAVTNEKARRPPLNPAIRYSAEEPFHHSVAKAAVSLIKPGDSIFLSGSVVHKVMVKYLEEDQSITVVTNSLEIATDLRGKKGIDTYLTGGNVPYSGNSVDSLASHFIDQFNFDVCFVVGTSINIDGLTTSNPEVALFHRKVLERSKRKICLANHYKFINSTFANIVPAENLDLIITDSLTPKHEIQKLLDRGVEVLIAED